MSVLHSLYWVFTTYNNFLLFALISILLTKLFWPNRRKKNVLVIEKHYWKFEVENTEFTKFLRSFEPVEGQNNFFESVYVFFNFYLRLLQIEHIRTILVPIETNNWDVETTEGHPFANSLLLLNARKNYCSVIVKVS